MARSSRVTVHVWWKDCWSYIVPTQWECNREKKRLFFPVNSLLSCQVLLLWYLLLSISNVPGRYIPWERGWWELWCGLCSPVKDIQFVIIRCVTEVCPDVWLSPSDGTIWCFGEKCRGLSTCTSLLLQKEFVLHFLCFEELIYKQLLTLMSFHLFLCMFQWRAKAATIFCS